MKTFKKTFTTVFLIMAFICWPAILLSQNWSQEQKEVLEANQKLVQLWASRDLDGYMGCLHEDFVGWFQNDPLPIDKNSLRNWESYWLSNVKILRYESKPVSINIIGNTAIIYTYDTTLREDEDGKKLRYSKWTVTLIKENGKWLIIGTSGGTISED